MWPAPLPIASTPLWQLAQLLVTPECEGAAAGRAGVAERGAAALPAPAGAPARAAAAAAVAVAVDEAATTLVTVLFAGILAAVCAPPSQLLVLWQPLQSFPT